MNSTPSQKLPPPFVGRSSLNPAKKFLLTYFEQILVLLVVVATLIIFYLIPQKLTFLDFYFLPILLSGYYLGARKTMLLGLFCFLVMFSGVILFPQDFLPSQNNMEIYLHMTTWGSFLVLSGFMVGNQQEAIQREMERTKELNFALRGQQEDLKRAHKELKDYSENLEKKVDDRTVELEKSKRAVEKLKDKVEETLYSTMDSSVVKLIIEGRLRNEKRSVSVMFSDLVGFTSFSEDRSPEIVVRDLNRYLNDMEPIILEYRGHIDKYMGDGIMSEFGAPLDYERYRLMAVLAGFKMQEKLQKQNYPWRMRIGIASGPSIVGLIGSRRQSYTTIGDVVNLSARLEKACPPGGVLVDRQTYEGVQRFFDAQLMKEIPLYDDVNEKIETQLEDLYKKIPACRDNREKSIMYYQIGQVYLNAAEPEKALESFETSLKLEPENNEFKLAFAEASMKKDEADRIKVKGRRQRVMAYEIRGLKDPLLDREKIPQKFYDRYKHVIKGVTIPEDILLPIEALDASIGHSRVVAVLSFALAVEFGLSEQEQHEILNAAFAADIGKEIVPHHLLNRGGVLSVSEFAEVKKHSLESLRILKKMGYSSEPIFLNIRHSHENYNGTGYPDGLKGDQIPVGSRIIAVADAYDALTSWRPYREPWDRRATFDELRKSSQNGIHDPLVVEALVRLLEG